MRKITRLSFFAAMTITFASCGSKTEQAPVQSADSTQQVTDTIAVATDSVAQANVAEEAQKAEEQAEEKTFTKGKYRCTGGNVCVRKGPGTNYKKMQSAFDVGPVHLSKGDVVYSDGKVENNFLHVREYLQYDQTEYLWHDQWGWVSCDYFEKK